MNTIGKTKKTIGNPKNGRKYDRKSEKTENNSHREPRARPIAENTIKHMVFQWFLHPQESPRRPRGTSRDPLGRPKDPQARPRNPSGILREPPGTPQGPPGPLRDPLRDQKGSWIRSEIEKTVVNTIENQKIWKQRPQGPPSVLLIAENTVKTMVFRCFLHTPRHAQGTPEEPLRDP